jgi:hypothetical protein
MWNRIPLNTIFLLVEERIVEFLVHT